MGAYEHHHRTDPDLVLGNVQGGADRGADAQGAEHESGDGGKYRLLKAGNFVSHVSSPVCVDRFLMADGTGQFSASFESD